MKQVFYSEILKRYFDSAQECEAEEEKYLIKQAEAVEAESRKAAEKSAQSARKKELAQAVEEAEKERSEAYSCYRAAEEEVKKILNESNAKMEAILKDARERVRAAETAKLTAISNFNKEFGPYKAFYSDERARTEYNNLFARFFGWF